MAGTKGDGGGNTAEGFDVQGAGADEEREVEEEYDDLPPLEYISEGGVEEEHGEDRSDKGDAPRQQQQQQQQAVRPSPLEICTLLALLRLGNVGFCPSRTRPLFCDTARPGWCANADHSPEKSEVSVIPVKYVFGTCTMADLTTTRGGGCARIRSKL